MRYTTVSRRVIKPKAKAKGKKTRSAPEPSSPTPNRNNGAQMATVPVLFGRVSAAPASVVAVAPWWRQWSTMTLAFCVVAALFVVVYWLTRDAPETRRSRESRVEERSAAQSQQDAARASATQTTSVNVRPMGYSDPMQRSAGSAGAMNMGHSGGGNGAAIGGGGGGGIRDGRGPIAHSQGSNAEEIRRATLDEGGRVVLPDDVAGSCSVGQSGIKGLSVCLSRSGGRVE